jgi:hypothetical protein
MKGPPSLNAWAIKAIMMDTSRGLAACLETVTLPGSLSEAVFTGFPLKGVIGL